MSRERSVSPYGGSAAILVIAAPSAQTGIGVFGELLDRFADDLELADDGVPAHPIDDDRVTPVRCVPLDMLDGVAKMTKADTIAP